jgi:hypothetical protein
MYAASRGISLPLVVLAVTYFRSRDGMAVMALTMGLVQLFDAVVGILSHDPFKAYGPLVLALITFASLAWLLRGSQDARIRRGGWRQHGDTCIELRSRLNKSARVLPFGSPRQME